MKYFLTIAICMSAIPAFARLGYTPKQMESKYGSPQENQIAFGKQVSGIVSLGDYRVACYRKEIKGKSFVIRCVYDKAGKVCGISYIATGDEHLKLVKKLNLGDNFKDYDMYKKRDSLKKELDDTVADARRKVPKYGKAYREKLIKDYKKQITEAYNSGFEVKPIGFAYTYSRFARTVNGKKKYLVPQYSVSSSGKRVYVNGTFWIKKHLRGFEKVMNKAKLKQKDLKSSDF